MNATEKRELAKQLAREFGVAAAAWGLFLLAVLFATASAEFTYAMY